MVGPQAAMTALESHDSQQNLAYYLEYSEKAILAAGPRKGLNLKPTDKEPKLTQPKLQPEQTNA
jgi:hypothetical protein